MGWRSREFLYLPLREEGGTAFGCPDLGDLSRLAVQSASDLCYLAICIVVRTDGGGHSEYLQEIPLIPLVSSRGGIDVLPGISWFADSIGYPESPEERSDIIGICQYKALFIDGLFLVRIYLIGLQCVHDESCARIHL